MKNPTALLFIQFSASFSFNAPRIVRYFVRQESIITDLSPSVMFAKNDKDEEDGPGMEDAFRQLDSLGSLDEGNLDLPPPKKKISKTIDTPASEPASLEQEAKLYTEMAKEVEAKQEDGLYDDILADMGGTGVPKVAREGPDYGMENTEEFMEHAFEAALQEAKDSDPSVAESVLDNKDLMQEIEAIFEQGNEKLLESLEEVRREQKELAQASAEEKANAASQNVGGDAKRFLQAESSMAAMLEKVNKETAEVEAAVSELKRVQKELDNDPISKLRSGGIVKQGALAGVLLFSVRSIVDTISALSGSADMLAPALIQGFIAIACAIVFFFL